LFEGPDPKAATKRAQLELLNKMNAFDRLLFSIEAKARARRLILSEEALLRHVLILGTTGSGKTNHAFHLITEAMSRENCPSCVVIDVKGEYKALKSFLSCDVRVFSVGGEPRAKFNPLAPPKGVDVAHWERAFADVFTRAYGLSEPSRRILLDSMYELRGNSAYTLRELEGQVAKFQTGSPKEQGSKRSLEGRLHIINTGPVGESLNSEESLDLEGMDRQVTIFEIGDVDSMRDQAFLAELLLLYLWQHDKKVETEHEVLKRLVVVEEAHRYLSEERPPEKRGERTLLELAIAEARRYGWGFVIVDQMPTLLSQYVWDNAGTVLAHRLANWESYLKVEGALVEDPANLGKRVNRDVMAPLFLKLPEYLAAYKRYVVGKTLLGEPSIGFVMVPEMEPGSQG